MNETEYLIFIPNGNVKPLNKKIRDLDGFYNGLGYIFPLENEPFVEELVSHFPQAKIHKLPLGPGQSFASLKQSHKAAWFQDKLVEIDKQILAFQSHYPLEDISEESIAKSNLSNDQKKILDELLQERLKIKHSLEYAIGIEKALNESKSPRKIDLKSISEISPEYFKIRPPEKPRLLHFVENDGKKSAFLHKGIVGMLVAEGGRGKTHLLSLLGSSVATGIPFLDVFAIDNPGAVCLVVGENDPDDVHRLLWKIREHLIKKLTENKSKKDHERFMLHFQDPIERLATNLFPISVHGMDASFIDSNGTRTDFYKSILAELKAKEPPEGWQLIILDPASRFAGTEAEKDNAIATAFIASLENISGELKGRPTIVLAHHKSKAAQKESSGQSDARGASGITDGVRWQANLNKHDKDDPNSSLFEVTKTNFTAIPKKIVIKKRFDGIPEFNSFGDNG